MKKEKILCFRYVFYDNIHIEFQNTNKFEM